MAGLLPTSQIEDDDSLTRAAPGGAASVEDDPPGPFRNFFSTVGMSGMAGFASAARMPLFAIGGSGARLADGFMDAKNRDAYFASGGRKKFTPTTENQDAFFGGDALQTVNNAVGYWTPDASTAGVASNFVGSIARLSTEAMSGGAISVIGSEMINTDLDLVNKGVDADTAGKIGLVAGAQNAFGLGFTGVGGKLVARLATNIAANAGFNTAATALEHKTLDDAGFAEEAKQFHAWDPHARALDVLAGGMMAAFHRGAAPLADADAALTAANANRVQTTSAPATPATAAGQSSHVDALNAALDAVSRGEKVDVAAMIDPADFKADRPNPRATVVAKEAKSTAIQSNLSGTARTVADAATTAGVDPQLVLAIGRIESGLKVDAANPTSSAKGIGQFLDSTWKAMGGTGENRFDEATQARILAEFTAKNTEDLRVSLGREPQPQEVYLAHLLGLKGAAKVLRAKPGAAMADVIGAKVAANNGMDGMSVSQALDHWKAKIEGAGARPADQPNNRASTNAPADDAAMSKTAPTAPTDSSPASADSDLRGVSESIRADDTPTAGGVNEPAVVPDPEPRTGPLADFEAARQTAAAMPDLQVAHNDGTFIPAQQAIDEMQGRLEESDRMSQLFDVAVNCALRGG